MTCPLLQEFTSRVVEGYANDRGCVHSNPRSILREPALLRTLTGHSMWHVDAVAVTPDGQRAVSASGDNTLKVWDLASGRELRTLTGHTDSVRAVAVTPDGQRAVSASGTRR